MTDCIETTTDATFLRSLGARYDHGHTIGGHVHGWGQLIYAASGAIHVAAAGQAWLIPPARALWLPPATPHSLRMRGVTSLRTLYVPPGHCAGLAAAPLGLIVAPVLRELVLEVVRIGHVTAADTLHRALGEALLALLARAEPLPLSLTLPRDRRALRAAEAILAGPGGCGTLDEIASRCGASLRTLQRRFIEETGMGMSEWRQTARLMEASALLLDGASVTGAALDVGYAGVSAFIHAFRCRIGQTPSAFLRAAAKGGA